MFSLKIPQRNENKYNYLWYRMNKQNICQPTNFSKSKLPTHWNRFRVVITVNMGIAQTCRKYANKWVQNEMWFLSHKTQKWHHQQTEQGSPGAAPTKYYVYAYINTTKRAIFVNMLPVAFSTNLRGLFWGRCLYIYEYILVCGVCLCTSWFEVCDFYLNWWNQCETFAVHI